MAKKRRVAKKRVLQKVTDIEQPFDQINTAIIRKGKTVKFSTENIPWYAFSTEPFDKKDVEENEVKPQREKLHPLLKKWMKERSGNEKEPIIINFRDDMKVPRFPEPVLDESRKSAKNVRALKRSHELINEIIERRADNYKKIENDIRNQYDGSVIETFWLINAVIAEMPLNRISSLIERDDVLYVEPQKSGEQPPSDGNPNNDVDDGRTRIVSDPYFNLNLTSGWIGLLDTGLRFTHVQFNAPSSIAFRRDCVNGGADCNTGTALNPNDDCWNHGTSSGAIITGNTRQGAAFRGVTAVTLDSFKVYPTSFSGGACNGGLDSGAAVRGFQNAVRALDRVIVAEMQGNGDDLSAISAAAEIAYEAGAVIIAANGNNGPNANTVNAPANAHRVIGVGNFDVQTLTQIPSQSRGPSRDGRIKPDIQAPTNTETASNASDTAFRVFGGTSGATPYAAGAAALLRNWLRANNPNIDAGQVYAELILSGQQPYPFNNTSGAGRLQLPTDGYMWWGKVSVQNGMTIDIPLNVSGTSLNTFDAALWWPETARREAEVHNDIDLYLIDPNGTARSSSISVNSIFERLRVNGPVAPGTWKLRILGYHVPSGNQTVYWAAHVRRI